MDGFLRGIPTPLRNPAANKGRIDVPPCALNAASRGTYDANANHIRALELIAVVAALVLVLVCANVANLCSRARHRASANSPSACRSARRVGGSFVNCSPRVCCWREWVDRRPSRSRAGDTRCCRRPSARASVRRARVQLCMIGATVSLESVFGIAPALRATKMDAGTSLKESSRSVAARRHLAPPRIAGAYRFPFRSCLLVAPGCSSDA